MKPYVEINREHFEMKAVSIQEQASKYLSDAVKAFQHAYNTEFYDHVNDVYLKCSVISKRVYKDELEESDIEDFCQIINRAQGLGVIESFALAPLCKIKLPPGNHYSYTHTSGSGPTVKTKKYSDQRSYLLLFCAFSRYTLEERRAMLKADDTKGIQHFTEEGEIPN